MVFKIGDDGSAVPMALGHVADGKMFLDVFQASEITGEDVEELRCRWVAAWGFEPPVETISGMQVNDAAIRVRPQDVKRWQDMSEAERDEMILVVLYPQLVPYDRRYWEIFKQVCAERKVSLLSRRMIPQVQAGELVYITKYELWREMAIRSKKIVSFGEEEWCGPDGVFKKVWTGKGPPSWARYTVIRKGINDPIVGKIEFKAYAPMFMLDGKPRLDPYWEQNPCGMSAKCAKVACLREAIPEVFGGFYWGGEMGRSPNAGLSPQSQSPGEPAEADEPKSADEEFVDEDVAREKFDALLMKVAAGDPDAAERIMSDMRIKYALLARRQPRLFYQRVATELSRMG